MPWHPDFDRSVSPISTMGADNAPASLLDFQTFPQPWCAQPNPTFARKSQAKFITLCSEIWKCYQIKSFNFWIGKKWQSRKNCALCLWCIPRRKGERDKRSNAKTSLPQSIMGYFLSSPSHLMPVHILLSRFHLDFIL